MATVFGQPFRVVSVRAICALLLVAIVRPAAAQAPDETPRGGLAERVSVGGEVTAGYGSKDPGFFNYATYAYDPMRNVRVVVDTSVRLSRQIEVLGQLRTDGLSHARLTALYVRVRPWRARQIDLQAGRVPTTFGLFGRSGYGADNPLVGRPLPYGYLTSLRRDALPATAADLIRMRGRGWLASFPRGNLTPDRGLPIVDPDSWDTGLQARVVRGKMEWTSALTQGSLGSPRVSDDNDGRALASRLVVRATPALTLGASASRGAFLSRSLADTLGSSARVESFRQTATAVDAQMASGRWQVRGEVMRSTWTLPSATDPALNSGVHALAGWLEGRVRVLPGVDVAARTERLAFSDLATATGAQPWESPVSRVEAGIVASPQRHVRLKFAAQRNRRPLGGRVRHDTLLAAQLGVWF